MSNAMRDIPEQYSTYYGYVQGMVDAISKQNIDIESEYIYGCVRIQSFRDRLLPSHRIDIYDCAAEIDRGTPYESTLQARMDQHDRPMLMLIGGLGSGKSTTLRYLKSQLHNNHQSEFEIVECGDIEGPGHMDHNDDLAEEDAPILAVLERVRKAVFKKLISSWLDEQQLGDLADNGMVTKSLRRLVIGTDLYYWAESEGKPYGTSFPNLILGEALLERRMSREEVLSLAESYQRAAAEADTKIGSLTSNIKNSMYFTSLVVGHYSDFLKRRGDARLILAVDNIDQLSSRSIESILKQIHNVTHWKPRPVERVRILVSVRPSSLDPKGSFTEELDYMYHYGPDCFDMMLSRVQHEVLSRSLADLHSNLLESDNSSECVRSMLIASFMYASVLKAGRRRNSEDRLSRDEYYPETHPDHAWLSRLELSESVMRSLAETLAAVTGTSCRYAISHARRYFRNLYLSESEALHRTTLQYGSESIRPKIRFGNAVSAILSRRGDDNQNPRIANLFRPASRGSNPQWPSLTKVRVLSQAAIRGRLQVYELCRDLSQYGIPMDITIDAINNMQERRSLLIWLSKNRPIEATERSLSEYVVISEMGLGYHSRVIGEFEYIWHCANELLSTTERGANFPAKVMSYSELVSRFGRTEIKQVAFRRFAEDTLPDSISYPEFGDMHTNRVIFSSLTRLLVSASSAIDLVDMNYAGRLANAVEDLSKLFIRWQISYRTLFGNDHYLIRYKEMCQECEGKLDFYLRKARGKGLPTEFATDLRNSLAKASSASERVTRARRTVFATNTADRDRGTLLAALSRLSEPATRMHDGLVNEAEASMAFRTYLELREQLTNRLENHVPSYMEICNTLERVTAHGHQATARMRELKSLSRTDLDWLSRDLEYIDQRKRDIKANAYRVDVMTKSHDMDRAKGCFGGICASLSDLGAWLGGKTNAVLSSEWIRFSESIST